MGQISAFFRRLTGAGGADAADAPEVPVGERIYAVGDIHGRSDLLKSALARINADILERPIAAPKIVFLGDYVDRGPDTRGVLDIMIGLNDRQEIILIGGNHEEFMLKALEGSDPAALASWLWAGGREALLSYDVRVPMNATDTELADALDEARDKVPTAHRAFLQSLKSYHVSGDYAFVHAGIRPGRPLDEQSPYDLKWIREEFTEHDGPHPFIIVHGHTPVEDPDVRPNRINIDTGAYITGTLTCLVLEGKSRRFL